MTIVEPYIAHCVECKTTFRFADSDITNEIPFEEQWTDHLGGYVRCPMCNKVIADWDTAISTNINQYGLDILLSSCLREAVKETCNDKITPEEFDQIFKLAYIKFEDGIRANPIKEERWQTP